MTATTSKLSDEDLIAQAQSLYESDQPQAAARLLLQVEAKSLDEPWQKDCLNKGKLADDLFHSLQGIPSGDGWKKQKEVHGEHDYIVYYKVEPGGKLLIQIQSPIPTSLYLPFLSLMNETDLYETWFPTWTVPRLGLNRSNRLKQPGRCEQLVQLTVDMPYPFNRREIIFWGFGFDDIDAKNIAGAKLLTPPAAHGAANGEWQDDIPDAEADVTRMDFEADFLFSDCPNDHPALPKKNKKSETASQDDEGGKKILLTVMITCDPKIPLLPSKLLNFGTRVAIGGIWSMILKLSEEVREGQRPAHAERIAAKRKEIYDWLEERCNVMTGSTKTGWKVVTPAVTPELDESEESEELET